MGTIATVTCSVCSEEFALPPHDYTERGGEMIPNYTECEDCENKRFAHSFGDQCETAKR